MSIDGRINDLMEAGWPSLTPTSIPSLFTNRGGEVTWITA